MANPYYHNALYQIQERNSAPQDVPSPGAAVSDRQIKSVPEPATFKPADEQLYSTSGSGISHALLADIQSRIQHDRDTNTRCQLLEAPLLSRGSVDGGAGDVHIGGGD
jgi:hypothetical protein